MAQSRARSISTDSAIRGALIDETYTVFRGWDFAQSKQDNLRSVAQGDRVGASSGGWAQKIAKVLNRRFDPAGRDRPLVDLAAAGCDREVWKPILLLHIS